MLAEAMFGRDAGAGCATVAMRASQAPAGALGAG